MVPGPVSHCLWAVPLCQGGEGCGGCNTTGECLFSRRQVSGEGGGYKLLAAIAAGGWVRQPRKGDLCQATASSLQSATLLLQCKGGEDGRRGGQEKEPLPQWSLNSPSDCQDQLQWPSPCSSQSHRQSADLILGQLL